MTRYHAFMRTPILSAAWCLITAGLAVPGVVAAQAMSAADIQAATERDHQLMMDELGIRKLRPGPSGDEKTPNHANYEESKANPFPNWPDPLVMNDGRAVRTPQRWERLRRPEIVEAFEHEVFGRVPAGAPRVDWQPGESEAERIGSIPVVATRVIGHVDNSADPAITVDIPMMLIKPARHQGRMPVLIMFVLGPPAFPAPVSPPPEAIARMNSALKAAMTRQDPSLEEVFRQHPAWEPIATPPFFSPPRPPGDPIQQLVADGWAVAQINPTSIQADNGAGLTRGVIGLVNKGAARKPDDWGALRAWAWGASRAYDYLAKDPDLDPQHIGIEGVSRYGKAALVAMAFDERFGMVLVGS